MKGLQGKVALVTGGGRGIGRRIAERLAGVGVRTAVCARTAEEIDATARRIAGAGGAAMAVPCDVTREEDVDRLFADVVGRYGRLDVLVNNAGVGRFGPLVELSTRDFDEVVAVNLRGTFLCCRAAMRQMMAQRAGYIVNVASVVGVKGYPLQSAYTAAKHGVMGLTKSLAVEAQEHGVRVSAILPGGVDTEMITRSRPDLDVSELMRPDDVADALLYLLNLSETVAVDQVTLRRRRSQPF
jgi:3-oxoacyl-[acyl-carrier protein] reductase